MQITMQMLTIIWHYSSLKRKRRNEERGGRGEGWEEEGSGRGSGVGGWVEELNSNAQKRGGAPIMTVG